MSKNERTPLLRSKSKNYDAFINLLTVWKIAKDLPTEKQGACLLLLIEDEAQQAALRVSEEDLNPNKVTRR